MTKKLFRIATVPHSLNVLLKGQLRFFNDYFEVTAISSGGVELDELQQSEGVKTFAIEMMRPISPLKDLRSLYRLYRYFKKEKPDIVHSISPKAGLLSMLAAKFAGVPIRVHTFTGLIFPYRKGVLKFVLISMDKLLATCATHIYPEGAGVKEDLERYKITSKKLKVLSNGNVNGIDLSHFNPDNFVKAQNTDLRESLGIAEDDFVFIFVGRIVKDKGINELVSAFKTLSKMRSVSVKTEAEFSDLKVDLKNEGDSFQKRNGLVGQFLNADKYFYNASSITGLKLRKRMGRLIYRYDYKKTENVSSQPDSKNSYFPDTAENLEQISDGIHSRIKLLLVGDLEQHLNPILNISLGEIEDNLQILSTGFVKDVRPYLALSNCLVLASYREGFPNAVLQAGAMGLPSIVSDVNGCNEIITDELNGLIVPPKSEISLKNAMLRLLNEKELTQKMIANSRKIIVERYSHQKIWEELRKDYEEYLEN